MVKRFGGKLRKLATCFNYKLDDLYVQLSMSDNRYCFISSFLFLVV